MAFRLLCSSLSWPPHPSPLSISTTGMLSIEPRRGSPASNGSKRCSHWRIAGESAVPERPGSAIPVDRCPLRGTRTCCGSSDNFWSGSACRPRSCLRLKCACPEPLVLSRRSVFCELHLGVRLSCGIAAGGSHAEYLLVLDCGRAGDSIRAGVGGADSADAGTGAGSSTSNDNAARGEAG